MTKSTLFFLFSGLLLQSVLFSCNQKHREVPSPEEIEIVKDFQQEGVNFEEPFLINSNEVKTFLSWIEKKEDFSQLKFSKFEQDKWSEPILVAEGDNWFVNWADYPQINAFDDGTLIAFFLKKSGPGTFSYDIMLTISKDGIHWETPFVLHDDLTQTEHGFVSMVPWGQNMLISWLDGRNTGGGHEGHGHEGHQGQMSLRAAILDNNGNKKEEWLLDERVCDCCQTSTGMTPDGPIVIFRDRSENEIRDIGFIKWNDGAWSSTMPLFMDLWEIQACPVNGPRVSTLGNTVAVAWYTAAKESPEVKVCFSSNNGNSFNRPIKIDLGKTIGRVDIELLDEDNAMVSWMEEGKIMLRKVGSNGKLGKPITVAVASEKRSSGFPQISKNNSHLWISWTDDSSTYKSIRLAKTELETLLGN